MKKLKDLPPISDDEEARIQAGIANDPDNPELTEEEIAQLRPARDVLHPDLYAALTTERPRTDRPGISGQEHVTIPLDRAVVDHFRAAGPEWPSRINEVLKKAIGADDAPHARRR